MRLRTLTAVILAIFFTLALIQPTLSFKPWRGVVIEAPKLVTGTPGQTITFEGNVTNVGWWWLHEFNLTIEGLPEGYSYTIDPNYWEHLRILREWNPVRGLYVVPYHFTVNITLPDNAIGVHLLEIRGQEFHSYKKYYNTTEFLLKVIGAPKFTITDMEIPETVTEWQPFNISMKVNNEGLTAGTINLTLTTPEDWEVPERTKTISVGANASESVVFTIVPTNTSGEISVFAEYPFGVTVLNITKIGPLLVPMPVTTTTVAALPTGFAAFVESLVEFIRGLSPLAIGIIVVLFVIVAWNLWVIYQRSKARKKPEEMKKKKD